MSFFCENSYAGKLQPCPIKKQFSLAFSVALTVVKIC